MPRPLADRGLVNGLGLGRLCQRAMRLAQLVTDLLELGADARR